MQTAPLEVILIFIEMIMTQYQIFALIAIN